MALCPEIWKSLNKIAEEKRLVAPDWPVDDKDLLLLKRNLLPHMSACASFCSKSFSSRSLQLLFDFFC